MKKYVLAGLFALVLVCGCVAGTPTIEQKCTDSGGTVSTSLCCGSASDFPNLCLIGACGCSSENSHEVKICDCGTDKCFDGTACVSR